MKRTILFLAILTGCGSFSKREIGYFQKLEKVRLGMAKSEVINILGAPNEEEQEIEGARTTYTIPYKNLALPKVIVWYDKSDRVDAKYIHLFDDDKMNRKQIESYFVGSRFHVESAPMPKDGHYIPSRKYLIDKANGIAVEINTSRNDEASFIHWQKPDPSPITTAD